MKHMKRGLALLLVFCMAVSFLSVGAFADDVQTTTESAEPQAEEVVEEITADEPEAAAENETQETAEATPIEEAVVEGTVETYESSGGTLDTSEFPTMVLIDCGRGYYSVENIEKIIDTMSANGYKYLMLGFGNDGLRFVLDDMSVTVNGTTYASDTVKNAVISANDTLQNNNGNGQWTEGDMDAIFAYAEEKNIGIVPMLNCPGHAYAVYKAMAAATGITNAYTAYSSSGTVNQYNYSIDLSNETVKGFVEGLVEKYIAYFADKGCKFFNLGCDETKYAVSQTVTYVNDVCATMPDTMVPMAFCDILKSTSGYPSNLVGIDWDGGNLSSNYNMNANDNWYYVLGKTGSGASGEWCTYQKSLKYTASTKVTTTLGGETAYGSILAVWNDNYVASDSYISNIQNLIASQAGANPSYFTVNKKVTEKDTDTGITVTAIGLTGLTVTKTSESTEANNQKTVKYDITPTNASGNYEGTAVVTIPIPSDWNKDTATISVYDASNSAKVESEVSADKTTISFTATHFSEYDLLYTVAAADNTDDISYDKVIDLTVDGDSKTETQADVNNSGKLDETNYDKSIATVSVSGTDATEGSSVENAVSSLSNNSYYYIKNSGGQYLNASGQFVDDIANAVKWTVNSSTTFSGTTYTLTYNNKYLRYNNGWTTSSKSKDATTLYFNDGTFYRTRTLDWFTYSYSYSNALGSPITVSTTDPVEASTTITFTPGNAGTTYYKVGDTTYKIVVAQKTQSVSTYVGSTSDSYTDATASTYKVTSGSDYVTVNASGNTISFAGKAAGTATIETTNCIYTVTVSNEDLSGVSPKTINLFCSTYAVTGNVDPGNGKSTISVSASEAYGVNGVDISTLVPATGTWEYSTEEAVTAFWKGVKLTSAYKQSGNTGTNQSMSGVNFSKIRYYGGQWSVYDMDNDIWVEIASTDEVDAYYLQKTTITKEVDTYVKDWALTTSNASSHTESTKQKAISFAVVYPDGQMSPATEDLIYENSTLIYWYNTQNMFLRVGVNDVYEVEKITYTAGERVNSSGKEYGSNTNDRWSTTDRIAWYKTTTADGSTWYDETTCWTSADGSDPVIDCSEIDAFQNSKFTTNDAILVLIYLKAVTTEDSLTVEYVDDTNNSSFLSYSVNVTNESTATEKGTFLNRLVQTSAVKTGEFTLDDAAYVTNAKGTNETFQKDLTEIPSLMSTAYASGMYDYVKAEISEDGKTLILHYTLNETAVGQIAASYVIDFGQPVSIPVSDIFPSAASGATYTVGSATYADTKISGTNVVYTPNTVLKNYDLFKVYCNGVGKTVKVYPASTVYYEAGFATGAAKSTTAQQTAKVGGVVSAGASNYGYDSNAATSTAALSGTATYTFTGTGTDIYVNSTENSGEMKIKIYKVENGVSTIKYLAFVQTTSLSDLYSGLTKTDEYGLVAYSRTNLPYGTYKIEITNYSGTSTISGFRVYNTLESSDEDDAGYAAYKSDLEEDPTFVEIRDQIIGAYAASGTTVVSNSDQVYDASSVSTDYNAGGDTTTDDTGAIIITRTVKTYNGTVDEDTGDNNEATYELYTEATNLQSMVDNGPKNELFLTPGESVVFAVNTSVSDSANTRKIQIGMHAVNKDAGSAANCTIIASDLIGSQVTTCQVKSSVDMFYGIATNTLTGGHYTIVVTNTSNSDIISITKLKICDDPDFAFAAVNMNAALNALYYDDNNQTEEEPEIVNGWNEIDGVWYYYTNATKGTYKTGWFKYSGKWYYFDEDGAMVVEDWVKDSGTWYYLNEDGEMALSSWIQDGDDWYYVNSKGAMVKGWQKIGKHYFYFDNNGIMQTGFQTISKKTYYLDEDGIMVTGLQTIEDVKYYFNSNGSMYTGWKYISNKWYYFTAEGAVQEDWAKISKKWYYFNEEAVMLTGWQEIEGDWYYLGTSGAMVNGWQKISKKYYYFVDGVMQTDFVTIGTKTYYLNEDGVMQTGWQEIEGDWYYFGTSGAMVNGWQKISKKYYYFDEGVMQTDFVTIGTKTYYLNEDGVMQTGWQEIEGSTYYFNASGVMQTGKVKIGTKYYTFDEDGMLEE